jgi:hypothetical protein
MLTYLHILLASARARWEALRADERGVLTTEAVLLCGLFVVIALTAVALISGGVMKKVNEIVGNLG